MNSPNKSASQEADAHPAVVPAPAPPPIIIPGYAGVLSPHMTDLWLQRRRRHEAAHAVVARERGGVVLRVVAGGPDLQFGCEIEWPELTTARANLDWLDPDSADAIRIAARKKIACLVAGHLSEQDIDNTELKVSERANDDKLIDNLPGDADLDQVINLLNEINQAQLEEITAAEDDAAGILADRVNRLNAIIAHLQNDWQLTDEPLVAALNL